MTDVVRGAPPTRSVVWGWCALVWAEVFAVVHVYWAVGGTVGLPSGVRVPDNRPLFVIDVVAVPLCAVGGLVALSLVHPAGRRVPLRLRRAGVAVMSLVCLVHSAPTVVAALVELLRGRAGTLPERMWISYYEYEPYWFLGGLLTAAVLWTTRRPTPPEPNRPHG